MKKFFALLFALLVVTIGATAQQQVTFADLPLIAQPAPVANGYGGLNWSNFWYVDPNQYQGAGLGYRNMFTRRDVAFVGGQSCAPVSRGCYGTIRSMGVHGAIQLESAMMAAGFATHQITMLAYRNGTYVGSFNVVLSTNPQCFMFPATWGTITELQIRTDEPGDFVVFWLSYYIVM